MFCVKSNAVLSYWLIDMKVLAIETSCDDTSLALISFDWSIFFCEQMISFSQIDIHDAFGGVVPELASREHLHQILLVFQSLSNKYNISIDNMMWMVDLVAVTQLPWLPWSLIIWRTLAAFLSMWYSKKMVYVNHLHWHIFSFLLDRDLSILKEKNLILSVSWWHSDLSMLSYIDKVEIWDKNRQFNIQKIWSTRDDAIGEVYDKISRLLGWPYPWWVWVSKKASSYLVHSDLKDIKIFFKRILLEENSFDFSFSGMKSQAYTFINKYKDLLGISEEENLPESLIEYICYEFQEAATDILVKKIFTAVSFYGVNLIALVWWVSANLRLREKIIDYKKIYENENWVSIDFYTPTKFDYCTDNAAMIWVAWLIKNNYILN